MQHEMMTNHDNVNLQYVTGHKSESVRVKTQSSLSHKSRLLVVLFVRAIGG